MKCEKCNHENSDYDIICEKCGSPLNIEKNIELKNIYNNKPRAIDIVKIVPDDSEIVFKNTKQKVKYAFTFILGTIFASLLIFIIFFIKNYKSSDIINKYEKFIDSASIAVIYLGTDNEVNKKIEDYSYKYDFSYMYVNCNKITALKRKQLKNRLKLKKIDSTIVVIKNKEIVDSVDDCSIETNVIDSFLYKNGIIAKEKGNPTIEVEKIDSAFKTDDAQILYVSNNKNELNNKHHELIKKFCEDNNIKYVNIEGYYLSDAQKLNIIAKLNYSEIHNEFFAIIDEGQLKYVTEYVPNNYNEIKNMVANYGILDDISINNMEQIDFNKLKNNIKLNSKNVFLIVSEDCIYCEKLKPIIGKISINNDLKVYYYVNEEDKNSLKDYFKSINYNENITIPMVIITENNKILDSIVGLSDKDYYVEKFKEYGVIK